MSSQLSHSTELSTTPSYALPSFGRQTVTNDPSSRGISDYDVTAAHYPIIHIPAQMPSTAPPTNSSAAIPPYHMTRKGMPTHHVMPDTSVHRSTSHAMKRVSLTMK